MTNKEAIERWAKYIIPTVFRAEHQLQDSKPEWNERLANLKDDEGPATAQKYCREIAEIIVKQAEDYVPDETLENKQ